MTSVIGLLGGGVTIWSGGFGGRPHQRSGVLPAQRRFASPNPACLRSARSATAVAVCHRGGGLPARAPVCQRGGGLPLRRRFASAAAGLPARGRFASTGAVCLCGAPSASAEAVCLYGARLPGGRPFATARAVCRCSARLRRKNGHFFPISAPCYDGGSDFVEPVHGVTLVDRQRPMHCVEPDCT